MTIPAGSNAGGGCRCPSNEPSIIATIASYRVELAAAGYSPRTVKVKIFTVASCARWAGVEPHELSRDHVVGWLAGRPLSPWSRRKYLEHLAAWARHARIPDLVEGIRKPPSPAGLPRPIPEPAFAAMLEVAKPGRELTFVLLGGYCGLRSHESAKVAVEDLEVIGDGHQLRLVGKGNKEAVLPCPPIVVAALEAAAAAVGGHGRLWPRASAKSVQRVVSRVAARAGVSAVSHQLRHRFGTSIYEASGHDLLLTQQLMRHASPATTAGYALLAAHRGAAVVASLPGASGEPVSGRHLRVVR